MIYLLYFVLFIVGLAWLTASAFAFATQGLKAWRYAAFFPAFAAVVLIRYPAAPIAIWLYSSPDRLYLTHWRWLETIDNTLAGDSGHQTEHMIGSDPLTWYNRVLWLWRNGGNRFNYEVIGCSATDRPDWAWTFRQAYILRGLWFLDVFLGWSPDSKLGRSKFVFTFRPKTKP
jgi:hypothetical protein